MITDFFSCSSSCVKFQVKTKANLGEKWITYVEPKRKYIFFASSILYIVRVAIRNIVLRYSVFPSTLHYNKQSVFRTRIQRHALSCYQNEKNKNIKEFIFLSRNWTYGHCIYNNMLKILKYLYNINIVCTYNTIIGTDRCFKYR